MSRAYESHNKVMIGRLLHAVNSGDAELMSHAIDQVFGRLLLPGPLYITRVEEG